MPTFQDHAACLALATVLKGDICEKVFAVEAHTVAKGMHVFRPGDTATRLYRVVSGSVGVSAVAPNGDEVMLHRYAAGDVFGELCFCRGVHVHFATALEPTTFVSAPARNVLDALRARPELALDLIRALSERLAGAYAELQAASADRLLTRLARKLFEMCATGDGDGWSRLPRPFTHDELATLLGVRRESVTRAMIDLRSLGLIDYTPHAPIRVSFSALRRFIEATRSADLLPQDQSR